MKSMPVVILLALMALVAVVTGCHHTARYDSHLVAADSLLRPDPDSALAIVEGVCCDSLAAKGDRTYKQDNPAHHTMHYNI